VVALRERVVRDPLTGMCGALAMSWPVGLKMAQEKSSLSFMLTLNAVFCSVKPICSAMDMKRLLNTSR
jgi:hypothetical protein